MKILLCSPYLNEPGVCRGGINIWANNIISYRQSINSDIEIIPVSFDRRNYVSVDSGIIKRVYLGIKEFASAIRESIRVMDVTKPDAIHVCTSASISLIKDIILLQAAKKKGIKTIVHFHFGRIPDLRLKNNWEWKLLKLTAKLANICITMDLESYNVLKENGFNTIYCPNPLSLAVMDQINKEKDIINRIPNKILFVGHVLPSKGVYELVDACMSLDDIELHIIGKVEEKVYSELKAIVSKKCDGAWCDFMGEINHEMVIREMMSASVFVLPSYTEGFPNVILEAMACGCPIVTTTVGAIPEMLDMYGENKYGICIEPRNSRLLYDGLKKMLNDFGFAKMCAKNAESRVQELYAIPVVWNKLVDIWKM